MTPPPYSTFTENKSPTSIQPSGRPDGRGLFLCFSAVQSGPISGLFSRFCVRSAEGRKSLWLAVLVLTSTYSSSSRRPLSERLYLRASRTEDLVLAF
jgi:hypothetical protein